MLKNLLTKKLYQFLSILFILSFPVYSNAANWQSTISTDGVHRTDKDTLLGSCVQQIRKAPLNYHSFGVLGSVFYSPYGGSLGQPIFKNFCATVKPHKLKLNIPVNPISPYYIENTDVGAEIAIKNDDGAVPNFELMYLPSPSTQLSGLDSGNAYESSGGKSAYEKCKETNKISIAALNLDNEVTGYFETLDQCKIHLESTVDIPIKNVESDGACYKLVPLVSGQRAIAQYNGSQGDMGNGWERCQCTTFGPTGQGIFYIDGYGSITEYAAVNDADKRHTGVSSRTELWTRKAQECLNDHPIQFYNASVGGCFSSLSVCKQSSCELRDKDKYLAPGSSNNFVTFQDLISNYSVQSGDPVLRCDCSVAHNQNYTPLLCASGLPGANCVETCKVVPGLLGSNTPIAPLSPLAFINVLANFLFWFAVILFIINFVTAGLEMVRSGDEPDKMKEATERITSSIFGFIFVLIASGLINYLIGFLNTYIQ